MVDLFSVFRNKKIKNIEQDFVMLTMNRRLAIPLSWKPDLLVS